MQAQTHASFPPTTPTPTTPPVTPTTCSYAFPALIRVMPAPLLQAARATVDSGRAARQWIEDKQKQKEESKRREEEDAAAAS